MDKISRIRANDYLDKWLDEKDNRMIILISHENIKNYTYDFHVEIKEKQLKLI